MVLSGEIDLTYRCNLKCRNCNRSCTQAPSRRDLPVERIAAFIRDSVARGRNWKRLFGPFNLAPLDRAPYPWSGFAGGIDRVFGFRRGAGNSPGRGENLRADLEIFCRRCGHFGFAWVTKRPRMSPIWVRAYERVHDPKRNSDRSTQDTEAWQQSKP